MPDKGWKAFERRIAKDFHGERRGAYVRGSDGGKNDIIASGWSIEVKLWSKPSWKVLVNDLHNAEARKEHGNDRAVAIMKEKRRQDKNAIAIMKSSDFFSIVDSLLARGYDWLYNIIIFDCEADAVKTWSDISKAIYKIDCDCETAIVRMRTEDPKNSIVAMRYKYLSIILTFYL